MQKEPYKCLSLTNEFSDTITLPHVKKTTTDLARKLNYMHKTNEADTHIRYRYKTLFKIEKNTIYLYETKKVI